MFTFEKLIIEFAQKGLPRSIKTIEKIKSYACLIENYNQHTNILGARSLDQVYKHILDCALGYPYFTPQKSIADVGSGSGLPGILLSILGLGPIYLVESKQKKAIFLQQAIKKLRLKNIVLQHQNAGEIAFPVDIITCRAFAAIHKCLRLTVKMRNPRTEYIFYKGKKKVIYEELEQAPFKIKKIVQLNSPFIQGERHLVIGRANNKKAE